MPRVVCACCRAIAVLGLLLAGAGGCGPASSPPRTFPVKGQVLFEGKPAAGALVVFHPVGAADPKAPRSYARAGADGTFRLSTYTLDDGAPAGRYAVTVLWSDGDDGPNRLPQEYAAVETSGLQAEVKEGPNDLPPFHLGRK